MQSEKHRLRVLEPRAFAFAKESRLLPVELNRPKYKTKAVQYMPYSISDTTAPVALYRTVAANVYPANCMGSSVPADLDVSFDNVYTKEKSLLHRVRDSRAADGWIVVFPRLLSLGRHPSSTEYPQALVTSLAS